MNFVDLGVIDYKQALDEQLAWLEKVQEDPSKAVFLFCTHPPVVTLGRSSQPGDVQGWQGQTVEVSRGGRATYHGPGQMVIYPILNLNEPPKAIRPRDINSYLRFLEASIVQTLLGFGVEAEVKDTVQYDNEGKKLSFTGVWVGEKKIASIGIAVKKWTTYHGVAINVWDDPEAFKGISPCGFSTEVMTSLTDLIDSKVPREELVHAYSKAFALIQG